MIILHFSPSVILDSLSRLFTSISFLTKYRNKDLTFNSACPKMAIQTLGQSLKSGFIGLADRYFCYVLLCLFF